MCVFLDESGDLGFNFNNKPSSHFVITVLVCRNRNALFAIKSAVKRTLLTKFRRKNDKPLLKELKGSETTLAIKKYFYVQLSKRYDQEWEIYSIVVDKVQLLNKIGQQPEPHRLYNILSREIMKRIDFSNVKENIQLFVDKCKGRHERNIFDNFLKNNIEPKLPINLSINIQHKFSHDVSGLQAVDLFCYGIARKHTLGDTNWYTRFAERIAEEVNWGPKFS